jgi:hypothetical protein
VAEEEAVHLHRLGRPPDHLEDPFLNHLAVPYRHPSVQLEVAEEALSHHLEAEEVAVHLHHLEAEEVAVHLHHLEVEVEALSHHLEVALCLILLLQYGC